MLQTAPPLTVSLARSEAELRAAQRLRYAVFVEELGGDGVGVDHANRLETDGFDAFADHLILRDLRRPSRDGGDVVGVYRLMTSDHAQMAGRFYSENEFDLDVLRSGPRRLLELGRSCLHRDYRGGGALMALFQGLARYVDAHALDTLFGVASFHGTDLATLRNPLSYLHHGHLAPPDMRVVSRTPEVLTPLPEAAVDRKSAMRDTPALIKSYLKLGGVIGQGVFVDHAFNTTDVCIVLDTAKLTSETLWTSSRRPV